MRFSIGRRSRNASAAGTIVQSTAAVCRGAAASATICSTRAEPAAAPSAAVVFTDDSVLKNLSRKRDRFFHFAHRPRRVRGVAANSFKLFFRRHARRKNSLRRSVTRALAPTNRRAMEREYFKQKSRRTALLFDQSLGPLCSLSYIHALTLLIGIRLFWKAMPVLLCTKARKPASSPLRASFGIM